MGSSPALIEDIIHSAIGAGLTTAATRPAPSRLLVPRYQVVSFTGREAELCDLHPSPAPSSPP